MTLRLVLASANPDKVTEIRAILGSIPGIVLDPRPTWAPDVPETGATLEDNARLKAQELARVTGRAAVADDTGLEVVALGGRPGAYSARYAGEGARYSDNVAKLLAALEGRSDRRARFRTVALASWPDGREVLAEGAVEGTITDRPRGRGGFGYDAVFLPGDGDGRTFAEMTANEKDALSHRGRAFRALAALLVEGEGLSSVCT